MPVKLQPLDSRTVPQSRKCALAHPQPHVETEPRVRVPLYTHREKAALALNRILGDRRAHSGELSYRSEKEMMV